MEFHPQFSLVPTHAVYMVWISAALTFLVLFVGARLVARATVSTGRYAHLVEAMVDFVRVSIVDEFLGEHGRRWFGFVATLFFFLLFSNLLGKLPWTWLESPTSLIDVTAILAVMVFLTAAGVGMWRLGPWAFLKRKLLLPDAPLPLRILCIPIMFLVWLAEPFSLCVRLFANMTAGHIVIVTFATAELVGGVWLWNSGTWQKLMVSLPFALTVVLLVFELAVAAIQAFIFALLSALYVSESLEEHH